MSSPRHRAAPGTTSPLSGTTSPISRLKDTRVIRSSADSRPIPRVLGVLCLSTVLALSACGIPGLPGATGAPDRQPETAVERASTLEESTAGSPEPSTPEAEGWEAVPGDLATGSQTHRVGAAAHALVLDYWTAENVSEWTPDSSPIINLTAHIEGPATGEAIRVTRFEAKLAGSGTLLATDTGSFAVEPPFAYSSGVVVPANPQGKSSKVIFTIDLLTETAPGSGVFTRQTVIDALTIGYAKPGTMSAVAAGEAAEG